VRAAYLISAHLECRYTSNICRGCRTGVPRWLTALETVHHNKAGCQVSERFSQQGHSQLPKGLVFESNQWLAAGSEIARARRKTRLKDCGP
jgi:hypothetical protein